MTGTAHYFLSVGLVEAGVDGPPSVGGGWSSSTAWVVAFAAIALLAGVAWLISDSSGRGRSAARDRQDSGGGMPPSGQDGPLPQDGGSRADRER